ncbi:MAG: C39 family peptidase [Bdellovibrionales bacterium]|nr:C39 family peptidase [Bdellovibrionales bacterium]
MTLLIVLAASRSYPLYKQCDSRWGNEQLGTSSNTICKAGCLMSSVAMALSGIGKSYNPSTLNTWLKGHGGYVSGDLFVWGSVNSLGLKYQGKVSNSNIASSLSAGHVVILNVHNGGHWVLATSMSGSTIYVNDPGYSTSSYTLSEIVANNSGLYHVGNSFLDIMIGSLEFALNIDGRRDKFMKEKQMIDQQ